MTVDLSKSRCRWPGQDPLYVAYHDEEWGVPEYDGQALWAKLVLDGFQAGLAWITILRKREAFRAAFQGFDPHIIAGYTEADVERLLADPGIVRSRSKILATIGNAKAYLAMQREEGRHSPNLSGASSAPRRSRIISPAAKTCRWRRRNPKRCQRP